MVSRACRSDGRERGGGGGGAHDLAYHGHMAIILASLQSLDRGRRVLGGGGGEGCSFAACLCRLIIERASLSRRNRGDYTSHLRPSPGDGDVFALVILIKTLVRIPHRFIIHRGG